MCASALTPIAVGTPVRLGEELGRTFLTWLRVAMSGTGVEFLEDPMALERLEQTGELGGLLEERFRVANAAQIEVARAEGHDAARAEGRESVVSPAPGGRMPGRGAEALGQALHGRDDGTGAGPRSAARARTPPQTDRHAVLDRKLRSGYALATFPVAAVPSLIAPLQTTSATRPWWQYFAPPFGPVSLRP